MPCVSDVVAFLERFAPLELAEEWDNVGLLAGDRRRDIERVITCLTLTPEVAREAIERQAALIVAHHPILFRAVKRITADDAQGRMLLELIAAGIAVYSPHTAYDSAADGINQQLAQRLGLTQIGALRTLPGPKTCKIVCFVPPMHLRAVQDALWSAGAGEIGEYSNCSFALEGIGSFEGSAAANPAIGKAECFEQVAEARLEVVCPEPLVQAALRRLREVHPYEEPAVDVYPLSSLAGAGGAGRVGVLAIRGADDAQIAAPSTLGEFLELVRQRLGIGELAFVGDRQKQVARVAVACGSGGEFLSSAVRQKCDVLLTGEARFHCCLEAREAGIALILAGHYATERPAMEHLAVVLSREFPQLDCWASETERDPIQWK